jgi:hypothetical protein
MIRLDRPKKTCSLCLVRGLKGGRKGWMRTVMYILCAVHTLCWGCLLHLDCHLPSSTLANQVLQLSNQGREVGAWWIVGYGSHTRHLSCEASCSIQQRRRSLLPILFTLGAISHHQWLESGQTGIGLSMWTGFSQFWMCAWTTFIFPAHLDLYPNICWSDFTA